MIAIHHDLYPVLGPGEIQRHNKSPLSNFLPSSFPNALPYFQSPFTRTNRHYIETFKTGNFFVPPQYIVIPIPSPPHFLLSLVFFCSLQKSESIKHCCSHNVSYKRNLVIWYYLKDGKKRKLHWSRDSTRHIVCHACPQRETVIFWTVSQCSSLCGTTVSEEFAASIFRIINK
jgi:hypothetical protein